MKIYKDLFNRIASLENIVTAWEEFRSDKGKKADVQTFEFSLEQNIFSLHRELQDRTYSHGPYTGFYIRDPKVRHIHKAEVRDRVLHHAVFRILNSVFEKTFIANSFSCRVGKGTHKGVLAAESMLRKESRNYTRTCYALKCDVRKFFDSIDHEILLVILKKRIVDPDTMWLMEQIVRSFSAGQTTLFDRHGLPIGNLTSQLFANVYMNEFDQFVKHEMKVKHYARYTDDFVVVSTDIKYLEGLIEPFQNFIGDKLKLTLHPKKISIRDVGQGSPVSSSFRSQSSTKSTKLFFTFSISFLSVCLYSFFSRCSTSLRVSGRRLRNTLAAICASPFLNASLHRKRVAYGSPRQASRRYPTLPCVTEKPVICFFFCFGVWSFQRA